MWRLSLTVAQMRDLPLDLHGLSFLGNVGYLIGN
jgi:hypothetical protein